MLILDEPTAGLDPKQIIETRDLIRSLAGDHTIVLSTHILPEVAQTCQRVVIINKGRVVAVDTPGQPDAQLKGAATLYVQVDAGGADAAAGAGGDSGRHARRGRRTRGERSGGSKSRASAARDVRREVARTIVNRGWGLLELRPMRMSLEEIFLQLTTEEQPATAPKPRARQRPGDVDRRRRPCVTSLAIARQGAARLLRLADRLGHHRPLRAALRLVLLRLPRATSCSRAMQMMQGGGSAERQPAPDPRRCCRTPA